MDEGLISNNLNLDNLITRFDREFDAVAQQGRREGVPVISPEIGRLLFFLARLIKARDILEIGTAIGYSTLWLAKAAMANGGRVVTIERDEKRCRQALTNIEKAGYSEIVSLVTGDALIELPRLTGTFDMVFLDAAKGQYPEFFRLVFPLLRPRGLLVTDNVLFRGMVFSDPVDVPKRYRTIYRRLNEYHAILLDNPDLVSVVLPLADGIALSQKVEGKS